METRESANSARGRSERATVEPALTDFQIFCSRRVIHHNAPKIIMPPSNWVIMTSGLNCRLKVSAPAMASANVISMVTSGIITC